VDGSLHLTVPSMNRLNQTESATFSILPCWAFFRDSVFIYFVNICICICSPLFELTVAGLLDGNSSEAFAVDSINLTSFFAEQMLFGVFTKTVI
jgi:hypothetical protein